MASMNGRWLALFLILLAPGVQAAPAVKGGGSATTYAAATPVTAARSSSTGLADESYLPEVPEDVVVDEGPDTGFEVVTIDDAAAFLAGGKAIFVDARSRQAWEMGHIPGAIDVPSSDFEKGYAAAKARLPKDAVIIVYCESSHCDQAVVVLNRLKALGYLHLLHYRQGWVIWDWSKQPREKDPKYKDWH